jgi:GNAT superfamily N-acetyltransferase
VVKHGPAPGLLAFDGEVAVGWCQLTPRAALHWLDRAWFVKRVDDMPVWSLSCFYVRQGYRRRGVTSVLVAAALKAAKRAGAPALEAYPVDTAVPKCTSNLFTGTATIFARAGFKTVARRVPHRPIMRHDLNGVARWVSHMRPKSPDHTSILQHRIRQQVHCIGTVEDVICAC